MVNSMNIFNSLSRNVKNIFVGSHRGDDFKLEPLPEKYKNNDPNDWFENPLDRMPIATNNNYSSPMYLFKAGTVAMRLNKFNRAEEYFSIIKQDYPNSTEAKNIDAFISKAVASNQ